MRSGCWFNAKDLSNDGKCNKAWGVNQRPKIQLSDDDDDIAWLADSELGEAPIDPGTYEGGEGKPLTPKHNKWCFRECERSSNCPVSEIPKLKSFEERRYNQPWKHLQTHKRGFTHGS